MNIKVKIFGPLRLRFEDYDSQTGMDLSLPDGAKVKDLLAHLEVNNNHGYMVTVDGKIKKKSEQLKHGEHLMILPVIAGG